MSNYSAQIQVRDRWAIIAYIRTLQFSQNANVQDLPAEVKAKLPVNNPVAGLTPNPPMNATKQPVSATGPGAE